MDEFIELNTEHLRREKGANPVHAYEFIMLRSHNVVLHGVESRRGFILLHVVMNISCTKDTTLFEQPIAQRNGQVLIARLGMSGKRG